MDDREFQEAIKRVREDHEHAMNLIGHRSPLTDEQKHKMAVTLVQQNRQYDEYFKRDAEIKSKSELTQEAWKAARQAAKEDNVEYRKVLQSGSWLNMGIALAIVVAILVLLKLRFP
jgi:hypothetical protein